VPSNVVTANTTAQTVFTVPYDKIGRIKFIEVDNQAASDITITVQDVFTPFATDETPSPSEVTKDRKVMTVGATSRAEFRDKAGTIVILGTCKVVASATSTDCKITIGYELE